MTATDHGSRNPSTDIVAPTMTNQPAISTKVLASTRPEVDANPSEMPLEVGGAATSAAAVAEPVSGRASLVTAGAAAPAVATATATVGGR